MNRSFASLVPLVAVGFLLSPAPAPAQQQGQPQQDQAVGAAAVRTREHAQTVQLDQHQVPVIAVLYGQQPTDTQIVALVSHPEAPQQDKEIVFTRQNATHRTVVHEGEQTGQPRRIVLIARRGQEDAQLEKITENQGVCVFGVRKPEPKQQQAQNQQQQQQGAQQGQAQGQGQPQDAAAQQAAAAQQQDPAAAAQQAAARQKAAEEEAKRKAAEPKPDVYEAIITVYSTTGR